MSHMQIPYYMEHYTFTINNWIMKEQKKTKFYRVLQLYSYLANCEVCILRFGRNFCSKKYFEKKERERNLNYFFFFAPNSLTLWDSDSLNGAKLTLIRQFIKFVTIFKNLNWLMGHPVQIHTELSDLLYREDILR